MIFGAAMSPVNVPPDLGTSVEFSGTSPAAVPVSFVDAVPKSEFSGTSPAAVPVSTKDAEPKSEFSGTSPAAVPVSTKDAEPKSLTSSLISVRASLI